MSMRVFGIVWDARAFNTKPQKIYGNFQCRRVGTGGYNRRLGIFIRNRGIKVQFNCVFVYVCRWQHFLNAVHQSMFITDNHFVVLHDIIIELKESTGIFCYFFPLFAICLLSLLCCLLLFYRMVCIESNYFYLLASTNSDTNTKMPQNFIFLCNENIQFTFI